MPAGRPIEYSKEILEKAQEYLDLCIDEEYDWTRTNGDKSTSYEHRIKVKLPSIEGLAVYLKVARSTIYEWEKIYPEFSDILEDIKAEQAQRLINNGLSGDYNPTIAKLILTKHDYSDKSEVNARVRTISDVLAKYGTPLSGQTMENAESLQDSEQE